MRANSSVFVVYCAARAVRSPHDSPRGPIAATLGGGVNRSASLKTATAPLFAQRNPVNGAV